MMRLTAKGHRGAPSPDAYKESGQRQGRARHGIFHAWILGLMVSVVIVLAPSAVLAQEGGCHLLDSATGPQRQILRCSSGPSVEAETMSEVKLVDPKGQGRPSAARIRSGAALIDIPHDYPGGFQIIMPRAVASVRGTVWAVDVVPRQTSVFVVEGQVAVRRITGGRSVVVGPGEGTDVRDDGAPLKVAHWSAERAAALLARFGR